ncbi:glycoside hydrolase family 24 protein [Pandoraea norimbergensis]|nr:glycoside hydrolase family 104 protein [Pandoraea norimbergensis]
MQRATFAAVVVVVMGGYFWLREQQRADEPGAIEPDAMDTAMGFFSDAAYLLDAAPTDDTSTDTDMAQTNRAAFLAMIRYSEGATYNTLFGGGTFNGYADHPRQYITKTVAGKPLTSSAAGAYQMLARTWDSLKARLSLPDFSPASQDAGAIELIREWGALPDVDAGRFAVAVQKVRKVWASLPGAGYGQPERALSALQQVYQNAGGVVYG